MSGRRGTSGRAWAYRARYLGLIGASALTLAPFLWVGTNAFKFFKDIVQWSWAFEPTLVNFRRVLFEQDVSFLRLGVNSLVIALASMAISLSCGALGAYSLSRFRWSRAVTAFVLGWMLFVHMVPPITFTGPFFLLARFFNVYNTYLPVIAAHTIITLPVVMWIMKSFFDELPKELEEAAMVDGCNRTGSFLRIALPLAGPGLGATAILAFLFSWNEFLFALTLTSTAEATTIPVGVAKFLQEFAVLYGEMSAAAILASIPALIFVAVAQKQLVKGLTLGAIKG
jgi:multiple sugar transport system permease protein